MSDQQDRRLAELRSWLNQCEGAADAALAPASADASFRRYYRLQTGKASRIVMDAPPAQESTAPFIQVAGFLEQMGLNSPRVLCASPEQGFLLLTDLGSRQYLDELEEFPGRADRLYGDAIEALVRLQERGVRHQSSLPPYDSRLLTFELSLFRDWLCEKHLGIRFDREEEAMWQGCVRFLVESALDQPRVFVHRDYHSRNLMVTPMSNPGILDFQDAVEGPVTYDLVSLLKDCYIRWPAERVRGWALDFHAATRQRPYLPSDVGTFLRYFELMGVQRHLKAAGIFARLCLRDGKHGYLNDIPRTLGYITEVAPRYPHLAFLARLIDERCLPAMRQGPGDVREPAAG